MEEKILSAFLYNNKLKFSEIEKLAKIRSNKLAYHIKKLVDKGVLIKTGESYELSETAESLIPYISEKRGVLSIVLVCLKKEGKIFLYERKKRPFKGKLSLPGGRLLEGESIEKCAERIMKEKFRINAKLEKINSVSLEHVIKRGKKIHSFILIFITASTKDEIEYLSLRGKKNNIIGSDWKLINGDLGREMEVSELVTEGD